MQKEVLSTFFNHLKYERKLSENTIIAYENDINQLQDFLKKTFDVPSLLDVEGHFLRSWIISLIEKKEAPSTINRKISCLKSFFKFAMRMEWISKNPTLKLIRPKLPKRLAKDIELPKLLDLKEYLRIQSELRKYIGNNADNYTYELSTPTFNAGLIGFSKKHHKFLLEKCIEILISDFDAKKKLQISLKLFPSWRSGRD
jgi:integrase